MILVEDLCEKCVLNSPVELAPPEIAVKVLGLVDMHAVGPLAVVFVFVLALLALGIIAARIFLRKPALVSGTNAAIHPPLEGGWKSIPSEARK